MKLLSLLLLGAVAPTLAQFDSLATNSDGSRLYFVSRLRQHGTDQPAHGKLFVADRAGVSPLLIRNREFTPFPTPSDYIGYTNFYNVTGVEIPSDVSSLAATVHSDCSWGSVCTSYDRRKTTLYDSDGRERANFSGALRLSPNGEWALRAKGGRAAFSTQRFVVHLTDGVEYEVPFDPPDYGRPPDASIANDGTAVFASFGYKRQLAVFRPSGELELPAVGPAESPRIDAGATVVVWAEVGEVSRSLRALGLRTDEIPRDLSVPGRDDFAVDISDDGRRILFLSRPVGSSIAQVFLVRPDGSERRSLTDEPEGIQSGVLSGDGSIAWALTRTGRVLRIYVDTGSREEVIGRVPAFSVKRATGSPGQVVTLSASVIAGQSVAVEINGGAAPVLDVVDGSVTFQVPWELPTGNHTVGLVSAAESDWGGETTMLVTPIFNAYFVGHPAKNHPLAVHQNWDALVTEEYPAEPGEVIHFYASGLGPVHPPVPTGAPAPVSSLSLVNVDLTCEIYFYYPASGDRRPVELLFAGIAPGTIGYYQISLRMPTNPLGRRSYDISCGGFLPGTHDSTNGVFRATVPVRAD